MTKRERDVPAVDMDELMDYDDGDVVWAHSGIKAEPWWPAMVVNPFLNVPPQVRNAAMPQSLCVMFLGPSESKSRDRDFGWVKKERIHPYLVKVTEFELQFVRCRKRDFISACLEAAEMVCEVDEDCFPVDLVTLETEQPGTSETATGRLCISCGTILEERKTRQSEAKNGSKKPARDLCTCCSVLFKAHQFCPNCMRAWMPNAREEFVKCTTCVEWIHAACVNVKIDQFEEVENESLKVKCARCRGRKYISPRPVTNVEAVTENLYKQDGSLKTMAPEKLRITCEKRVPGIYYPRVHKVLCRCKSCVGDKIDILHSLTEFERHAGSRQKKWKSSMFLKDSDVKLFDWLCDALSKDLGGLGWPPPDKDGMKPTTKKEKNLLIELTSTFEPIEAKWTSEHCAVCFDPYDAPENKMAICNKCQIAVHEGCYGVRVAEVGGNWICNSCQNPDPSRECCLCPVKGGAMKPTTFAGLWAHLTCSWWVPETCVQDTEKMEPIEGVQDIDPDRFKALGCSICQQPHGACLQCDGKKCRQAFHAVCAQRAGYSMEMRERKKGRKTVVVKTSMCPQHKERKVDADSECFLAAVAEAKQRQLANGGRLKGQAEKLLQWRLAVLPQVDPTEQVSTPVGEEQRGGNDDMEVERSAARCTPYSPVKASEKKRPSRFVPYVLGGPCVQPFERVALLQPTKAPPELSSMSDRLKHVQDTFNERVVFGKSTIHDWGLMARRAIHKGEMVFEYYGMEGRSSFADVKEKRYKERRKDCYMFDTDDHTTIDSTESGNIGRLINHSCDPNCYATILESTYSENGVEKTKGHIIFFAREDIQAGQELTYDYKMKEAKDRVTCLCGAAKCRKLL